ncbi:MAG: hypothetical protein ABSD74_05540 [Rhizomicrobium sp.]|jgi:hypothetical protein
MNLRLLAGIAVVLAYVTPVCAETRDDVLDALGKCAAVADDKERLACYDAIAPHVKQALATPPAELPGNRPPTKEEQQSWFGFNLDHLFGADTAQQTTPQQFGADQLPETHAKEDTAAKEVDSITARVTEYAYTPFGKFIVFLDNGQVWRQVPGDADHATFHKAASDNTVTVSRGFLGTYNLKINDSEKIFKAERVK